MEDIADDGNRGIREPRQHPIHGDHEAAGGRTEAVHGGRVERLHLRDELPVLSRILEQGFELDTREIDSGNGQSRQKQCATDIYIEVQGRPTNPEIIHFRHRKTRN